MAARLCLQRALSSLRPSHMLKKNLACMHTGSFESFSKAYTARKVNDTEEDAHVLVRNFIGAALYDPMVGYFSDKFEVVGALREPLQFNVFEGRKAYMKYLDNLYRQNDISWFTPVEVFQPWYAYAIGEYILRCHDSKLPLMIYEIGGGTGTCARNILDYIKATAPAIYQTMKYTSVEISAALANKQNNFVHKVKSHQARYHAECHSAQDKVAWGPSNAKPCFVIMLEVLDNLPHDLVYRGNTTTPWMETWISQSNGTLSETRSPLQDPLIKSCLRIIENEDDHHMSRFLSSIRLMFSKLISFPKLMWIPTGCLELLQTLHQVRPNMSLIISDFSSLPDVKIPGERAPLVASKRKGVTRDHCTYLEAKDQNHDVLLRTHRTHELAKTMTLASSATDALGYSTRHFSQARWLEVENQTLGDADIFFPTDFLILQKLDHYCANDSSDGKFLESAANIKRLSSIVTSCEFMKKFAQTSKTRTKDGYNPLLEDYSNTRFYLSTPA